MPCAEAACASMQEAMEKLKQEHEHLLQDKVKWDEERTTMSRQVEALTTQNDQLLQRLKERAAAEPVLETSELIDIRTKWADALQREQALSETLRQLELAAQDASKEEQCRLDEVKTDLELKERELRKVLLEVDRWKKEHAEMRAELEGLEARVRASTTSTTDATNATHAATSALSQRIRQLEEDKRLLEQKVLDMDATNATVDKMILDFKSSFDTERQTLLAQLHESKQRVQQLENAGSSMEIAKDLEAKVAILQEMRVQDKELVADVRRELKLKQMEVATFQTNYVHKDSWQHIEAQLKFANQENDILRQQLAQLQEAAKKVVAPEPTPAPCVESNTQATPSTPPSRSMHASTAKHKPSVVVLDSKEELEAQFQAGLELDHCLDECATLYFENRQLVEKVATIEAALVGVQDQQAVLYREYIGQQQSFKARKQQLDAQLAASQTTIDEQAIKLNRFETMWQTMQVQSEWQQNAADMARRLALFEVNQARLARQHNILMDEKHTEYTRRVAVEDQLLDVEKALKTRLQYLESWKLGAMQRMQAMQKALHQSVLKTHYDALQDAYHTLHETYANQLDRWNSLHAVYVEALDLKAENTKLLHENALLRVGPSSTSSAATLQDERIQALEITLKSYAAQIKELTNPPAAAPTPPRHAESEHNQPTLQVVLEHRIAELEQCCTALQQDVEKHKSIAALAASQANTLALRQTRHRDEVSQLEERLRELGSRSDDDAIIGQLQQRLLTIQANYHSFTDRYEKALETQRAAQLQVNTLTLQLDAVTQHYTSELELERQTNRVLESTIATLKQSDQRAKIKRLEAMATRIESLEEDAVELHAKKRALERRVEELEAGMPTPATGNPSDDMHELQRCKHRIAILEQKERLWVEQIDQLAQSNVPKETFHEKWRHEKAALQGKLDQALYEMDGLKTKCSKLLQESSQKDVKLRDLQLKLDNLVLESQLESSMSQPPPDVTPAQGATLSRQPSSPSMRKKVGYYEKDHLALQEAAQATIASLKALVNDKNIRIDEYQRQLEKMREEFDAKQRAAHEDQERRNRRLYEDNHVYIGQLKEAMDKIQQLEEHGGGKAVVAAREMHQGLLEQLKQVHMDLELKGQIVQELQAKIDQLRQGKKTAEIRCGEALEEIAALQKVNHALVDDVESAQKDKARQTAQWKADLQAKDKKMALLRDAIIKLKEEFLKAQEQQAEENVREKRKQLSQHDDRVDNLTEKNAQLTCTMLQEKAEGLQTDLDDLNKKYKRAMALVARAKVAPPAVSRESQELKSTVSELREELNRCKTKLGTYSSQERDLDVLQARVKVLESKNAALREAAATAQEPVLVTNQDESDKPDGNSEKRRAAWEQEKKLKRRIEFLASKLDEKSAEVDKLTSQCHRLTEHLTKTQLQLADALKQPRHQPAPPLPGVSLRENTALELDNCYHRIVELQQQVLDAREAALAQLDMTPLVEERLQRETKVLELSFQVESLQIELQRARQSATPSTQPTAPTVEGKREPATVTTVAALEDVISNMKRVMEKLRSENERLRKHLKPASKHAASNATKELQQLSAVLDGTKAELQQLRVEHADLARKFRALGAKYKTLKDAQKSHTSSAAYVADMERLHSVQLQEKDMQIHALQQELILRSSAHASLTDDRLPRDEHDGNVELIRRLREENARLTEELSAFDLDFFDEIEDLKFKYAQAVRQKQALEKQLANSTRLE
ncbi:hypothetical protein, variant [Aphanomyces invadans]|uniref:Centrosomal protein of 290kDa coiled-coil region domain-containing protein n=1 Tax=Aphanomyces invadans TaxID=157072 RepID=A0A024TPP7_9STRA|nr:hypothetical protein, variant [Aphanomyces invadans]ETV96125.1 hypothetical protein, variant [Aphanomyces invadans]|eukprot:XP_008875436.1 hypothetical protein, variant [Aphanomyces invadans]